MEYLFQVSIGPVQSFIASARRSRDLKFGSWLLSELAKAAAKQIVDEDRSNILIFPAPEPGELITNPEFNAPNKIVAIIHQEPDTLGNNLRKAIDDRLDKMREQAYSNISGDFDRQAANAQIADLVEYFWAAVPFQNDYYEKRQELEALMTARKNTRDFRPVIWGKPRPKSSIDGQLESVIDEAKYPQHEKDEKKKAEKINYLYEHYKAGPAERLSGVDLLKRNGLFGDEAIFPATSHIAAIPYLERLRLLSDKVKAKRKWQEYIDELKRLSASTEQKIEFEHIPRGYEIHPILDNYEGSMLFEERLVEMVEEPKDFKPATQKLRDFFQYVDDELGKASPNPYYAILIADGDSMGKVIDHQAEIEGGVISHRKLSHALDNFAASVRSIVEHKDYRGSLFYAGGDDVLALLPLHTVLACAKKLARRFRDDLNGFSDHMGTKPTLSVGIAVVHHLFPLQDALKLAHSAEKSAKKIPGKNAVAVTISKRSGGEFTVVEKWKAPDDSAATRLEQLIAIVRANDISRGGAYELRDLALRFEGAAFPDKPMPADAEAPPVLPEHLLFDDAKRILKRKLTDRDKARAKRILENLVSLLENTSQYGEEKPSSVEAVKHFANELIAAQLFADAQELSKSKKGAQQ